MKQCKKGFTLMELLVVIAIFGVLAALAMANYRGKGVKTDLESQTQKFISVLKQAQMMALTGEEVDGSRPDGYGVYIIDAGSYVFFADKDDSDNRSAGDIDIQTFNLPNNMAIDSIGVNIIFKPPHADIIIAGVVDQKIIIFSIGAQTKQVIIDVRTGQIDIQ